MSWRKRVAVALGVLGALLLALLGALTWVIGSERGTTWLITTFVSDRRRSRSGASKGLCSTELRSATSRYA